MRRNIAALVFLTLAGCTSKEDKELAAETFQGKTGKEWVALSHDTDVKTRSYAAVALGRLKSAAAHARATEMLKDPDAYVQTMALQEARQHATDDQIVAAMVSIAQKSGLSKIKHRNEASNHVTCDAYLAAAQQLGRKASPVVPELKRIQKEYVDDNATTTADAGSDLNMWDTEVSMLGDLMASILKGSP